VRQIMLYLPQISTFNFICFVNSKYYLNGGTFSASREYVLTQLYMYN
jgi:hypothetical protein